MLYGIGAVIVIAAISIYSYYYRVPDFDNISKRLVGNVAELGDATNIINIISPEAGDVYETGGLLKVEWEPASGEIADDETAHTLYIIPKKKKAMVIASKVPGNKITRRIPYVFEGEYRIGIKGTWGEGVMEEYFTIIKTEE